MEILKFTLSGKTAFFKIPDVNSYVYFSYGNIHKIAILGILGAILGLGGYNKQEEEKTIFPEFYDKLKELKIAIIPKGSFSKKIQSFNNSIGYASYEESGNLIVKEQWLENVSWDIFIKLENTGITVDLKNRLKNLKFKYNIYLGKNEHLANITAIEIFKGKEIDKITKVDSLFTLEAHEFFSSDYSYFYKEYLPYQLGEVLNEYITKAFYYSDILIKKNNLVEILELGKIIDFI